MAYRQHRRRTSGTTIEKVAPSYPPSEPQLASAAPISSSEPRLPQPLTRRSSSESDSHKIAAIALLHLLRSVGLVLIGRRDGGRRERELGFE